MTRHIEGDAFTRGLSGSRHASVPWSLATTATGIRVDAAVFDKVRYEAFGSYFMDA